MSRKQLCCIISQLLYARRYLFPYRYNVILIGDVVTTNLSGSSRLESVL